MNRNKLIELFISNLTNVVVHQILEQAIDKQKISEVYNKEVKNSWEIAKRYREKINPVNKNLPGRDIEEIKKKIIKRVRAELKSRIEKGYENIDISFAEEFVEKSLKEMKII